MEKRASSQLSALGGRLCRLKGLLDDCKLHGTQSNKKSFADFLLIPEVDSDRRSIGGTISANLELPWTTLPLDGSKFG